jgi:hypothetical protein
MELSAKVALRRRLKETHSQAVNFGSTGGLVPSIIPPSITTSVSVM